jgi:hypothetical protein
MSSCVRSYRGIMVSQIFVLSSSLLLMRVMFSADILVNALRGDIAHFYRLCGGNIEYIGLLFSESKPVDRTHISSFFH